MSTTERSGRLGGALAAPPAARPCLPDLMTHAVTMQPVVVEPATTENPFVVALRMVKARSRTFRQERSFMAVLRERFKAHDDFTLTLVLEYLADLSAPWASLTNRYRDQLIAQMGRLLKDLTRLLRRPLLVAVTLHRTDVATATRLRIVALSSAPGAPPASPLLHPTEGLPGAS